MLYHKALAGDDRALADAMELVSHHYRTRAKTKTGVWRDLAVRKRKTEASFFDITLTRSAAQRSPASHARNARADPRHRRRAPTDGVGQPRRARESRRHVSDAHWRYRDPLEPALTAVSDLLWSTPHDRARTQSGRGRAPPSTTSHLSVRPRASAADERSSACRRRRASRWRTAPSSRASRIRSPHRPTRSTASSWTRATGTPRTMRASPPPAASRWSTGSPRPRRPGRPRAPARSRRSSSTPITCTT